MGFTTQNGKKMTEPDTYSESAHLACSNTLHGRNALIIDFLTAYALPIKIQILKLKFHYI